MTVVPAAGRLEDHGPAVDGGEGAHLCGQGLGRGTPYLGPGGLGQAMGIHGTAHGELVAGHEEGAGTGLDAHPFGGQALQELRVLQLVLEGEDVRRPRAFQQGPHGGLVVRGAHGRVRRDLRGGPVRRLHQCPQVDPQGAGLLLHHAGQLPASDDGDDGCSHAPRLPAANAGPRPPAGRPGSPPAGRGGSRQPGFGACPGMATRLSAQVPADHIGSPKFT